MTYADQPSSSGPPDPREDLTGASPETATEPAAAPVPVEAPSDVPDEAAEAEDAPDPIDLIARAVRAVPGVFDLHAGVLGEVATYLPGRRVNGIRLRSPGADIHLVLEWGAVIATTTELVRSAVRARVEGPIDVTVEDIAPPGETPAEESVSS